MGSPNGIKCMGIVRGLDFFQTDLIDMEKKNVKR